MKSNPKLVSSLFFIWLISLSTFVYAASAGLAPFFQDVHDFDIKSLLAAAGAGLFGGAGRTIYSLASDKVVVGNLWKEGLKDAILALMGGVVAWAFFTVLSPLFPAVLTSPVRLLAVVYAGSMRGGWATVADRFVGNLLSAVNKRVASAVGGGESTPDTPSAIAPLEDAK